MTREDRVHFDKTVGTIVFAAFAGVIVVAGGGTLVSFLIYQIQLAFF
jgi:hypothetical protein